MIAPLSVKDNDKWVDTHVGKTTEIHLKGNPTTGYMWTRVGFVGKDVLSDEILEVVCKYTPTPSSTPMVGVGGIYVVLVKPRKRGHHTLELVYTRPFEGIKPENERYTLHLNVK
ncbi:inhibitor of cysteine peptidase [Leishmania mexicana MHOM/GT/2001/U1103]|uniref:Inhibitor of cysteine peptidase n=2 Tax=Leishmania mexicana TaxID=5665 RepID=E9AX22_LEIMU|nr:inhibitor of cysteine peptidase [Leishmania mexicana MHOM/GT/2001/U1103]CAD68975.1 inhibitor of cysteine peptidases [Leishmania mexicana]CBZ27508.1 inhibitor of cysteine peptidase [Leishmania mexicana MHOM/GT/2001/U1103]